ncbi:MAG: crosslink repair DNA glycosylase YcaQ family protein [Nocardioidaceae bacterium]
MTRTIAHTRLLSQRIVGSDLATPGEVVNWMGALQAQDYQQALWAVGLRTRQASRLDVEAAISSREIVRTWPQRGTLHFVPAEDARWMLELSAGRMVAKDVRRAQQLELDEEILGRCRRLVESALGAGGGFSRSGMMQLFESADISTSGQRGYHILWRLAQEQVICLGPMEGKQQTFVLLDEWVRRLADLSRTRGLGRTGDALLQEPRTSHRSRLAHRWAGLADGWRQNGDGGGRCGPDQDAR